MEYFLHQRDTAEVRRIPCRLGKIGSTSARLRTELRRRSDLVPTLSAIKMPPTHFGRFMIAIFIGPRSCSACAHGKPSYFAAAYRDTARLGFCAHASIPFSNLRHVYEMLILSSVRWHDTLRGLLSIGSIGILGDLVTSDASAPIVYAVECDRHVVEHARRRSSVEKDATYSNHSYVSRSHS